MACLLLRLHCANSEVKRCLRRIHSIDDFEDIRKLQKWVEILTRLLDEPEMSLSAVTDICEHFKSVFLVAGLPSKGDEMVDIADRFVAFGVHERLLKVVKIDMEITVELHQLLECCYFILTQISHFCSICSLIKELAEEFPAFLSHVSSGILNANRLCINMLLQSECLCQWYERFALISLKMILHQPSYAQIESLHALVEKRSCLLPPSMKMTISRTICESSGPGSCMGNLVALRGGSNEAKAALIEELNESPRMVFEVLHLLRCCATEELRADDLEKEPQFVRVDLDVAELLRKFFPEKEISGLIPRLDKLEMKAAFIQFLSSVHTPRNMSSASILVLLTDFAESIQTFIAQDGGKEEAACVQNDSLSLLSCPWGGKKSVNMSLKLYIFESVLPFVTSVMHDGLHFGMMDSLFDLLLALVDSCSSEFVSVLSNCFIHISQKTVSSNMTKLRKALTELNSRNTVRNLGEEAKALTQHPKLSSTFSSEDEKQLVPLTQMFLQPGNEENELKVSCLEKVFRVLVRCAADREPPKVGCQWMVVNKTKFICNFLKALAPLIDRFRDVLVHKSSLIWMLTHLLGNSRQKILLACIPLLTRCVLDGHVPAQQLLFNQPIVPKFKMLHNFKKILCSDRGCSKLTASVLVLLKEMCEGHFGLWQNGLRGIGHCEGVAKGCDLVEEVVALIQTKGNIFKAFIYWNAFCPDLQQLSRLIALVYYCLCTLSEMCQGPCEGNQKVLVNGELPRFFNSLIHGFLLGEIHRGDKVYGDWNVKLPSNPCGEDRRTSFVVLQLSLLDALHALLEGGQGNCIVRKNVTKLAYSLNWNLIEKLLDQYRSQLLEIPRKQRSSSHTHTLICRYIFLIRSTLQKTDDPPSTLKTLGDEKSVVMQQCVFLVKPHLGTVEILNPAGRLEQLYFIIPPKILMRTESAEFKQLQQEVRFGVPRDNPVRKVQVFVEKYVEQLVFELIAFETIKTLYIVKLQPQLLLWSFRLAILLNILTIISESLYFDLLYLKWMIFIVGVLHFLLSCARLISCSLSRFPLIYFTTFPTGSLKCFSFQGAIKKISWYTIFGSIPIYHCLYVCASWKALESCHVYAICLFDLIDRLPILSVTTHSLKHQAATLAATALLWFVIMYNYAVFGHLLFQSDFPDDSNSLWHCILHVLNFGLRSGGGIGDVLNGTQAWQGYGRMVFDISFFIVSTLIMTNIVAGTIIDAFGESRDRRNEVGFA